MFCGRSFRKQTVPSRSPTPHPVRDLVRGRSHRTARPPPCPPSVEPHPRTGPEAGTHVSEDCAEQDRTREPKSTGGRPSPARRHDYSAANPNPHWTFSRDPRRFAPVTSRSRSCSAASTPGPDRHLTAEAEGVRLRAFPDPFGASKRRSPRCFGARGRSRPEPVVIQPRNTAA